MAEINEIVSQETINTLKETRKLLIEVTEKMNNLFMSYMKPEKPERLLKFEDIAETEKYKLFEITWNGFGDKKLFEKIKAFGQLLILADYYNEGWQPDWSNKSENKYTPFYDYEDNEIYTEDYYVINDNGINFKSKELLQTAIENNREIFEAYLK